jgi:hypothetical protein
VGLRFAERKLKFKHTSHINKSTAAVARNFQLDNSFSARQNLMFQDIAKIYEWNVQRNEKTLVLLEARW